MRHLAYPMALACLAAGAFAGPAIVVDEYFSPLLMEITASPRSVKSKRVGAKPRKRPNRQTVSRRVRRKHRRAA